MEIQEDQVEVQTKTRSKRPWGKYFKRAAIGAILLAVLLRAALPLILPGLVSRVAAGQGLQVEYSKLDLSLFTGSLELWNVSVRPTSPEGEAPASRLGLLEFLTVDLDLSALFGGTLRAHRVEIDGLDVFARRDSLEKGWVWESLLTTPTSEVAQDSSSEPEEAPAAEEASTDPFDWSLGFEVAAIRLQHLQLHVQDAAVEPAFAADLELNVRLSHLGLAEMPARLEVYAHSLEFLDGFSVQGQLLAKGPNLEVVCEVDMRGLRPGALAPYLEPLGIVPLTHTIDCGLQLEVHTHAANDEATALALDAVVRDVHWLADGQEHFALDEITVQVPRFSRGGVVAETARIRGIRGHAGRMSDGALALGGFRFEGMPSSAEPAMKSEVDAPPAPAPKQAANGSPFDLSIPKLELSEVQLFWKDQALTPQPSLELQLSELTVGPLQRQAGIPAGIIQIEGRMASPGVVESMSMKGAVDAFADLQTVDLDLAMSGLRPDRLAPYLNAAGLRSDFQAGSAKARIQAQTHVDPAGVRHLDASLSDVELADGETLFGIQSMEVKGLALDGEQGSTRIEDVSLTGTRLKARRDGEGLWHVLGLTLDPSLAGTHGSVATQTQSPSTPEGPAPVPVADTETAQDSGPVALLELGRLACTGFQIELLDESRSPQVHQIFDDMGLVLTGLSLGGDAARELPPPAELELWFRADGLAERLALQGTLQSRPGPLDLMAQLQVIGQGLELTAVEPWLAEAGLESTWQDAQLGMGIETHVQQLGAETRVAASLANLKFENQGETWLALGALNVPSVVLSEAGIAMEPISIEAPEVLLRRDAQGVLEAMGLRVLGVDASESSTNPATKPATQTATQTAEPAAETPSSVLNLAALQIQGVRVRWQDAFLPQPVDTSLRFDLDLQNLLVGRASADPTTWEATVAVDDNLDQLRLRGQAWLDPADLRIQMQIAMQGLRRGSLDAYMPPNLEMELADGRFLWEIGARYRESETGGHSLTFEGDNLSFRDGDSPTHLLSLTRLSLDVPILDPEGHRFDIQEATFAGLDIPVRIDTEGRLHGFGFVVTPAPAGEPTEVSVPTAAEPAPESEALTPGGTQGVLVSRAEDRILPLITLSGLDVGIERFSFVDERGGAPLDFGLRLTQVEPMTLLSPEAADLPAMHFQVLGAAQPIVDSIAVDLQVAPYASEPSFDAQLVISGVHGDQVTRVLPALEGVLDGSAWTDGRLEAHLQSQIVARRRGPLDFNFSQGFGLELVVDHVSARATADGPDLMGFEELTATVASIRPGTGDVHVKRVEWVSPHGSAWKDAEGLHAAGWVLKTPPPVEGSVGAADSESETAAVDSTVESTEESVASTGGVGESGESISVSADGETERSHESGATEEPPAGATAAEVPDETALAAEGVPAGAPSEVDSQGAARSEAETSAGEAASDPGVAKASIEELPAPSPEIRIDEMLISGGTFLFEDRSVEPNFVFPIDDVDVEIKRFTTRTLEEAQPFGFRLTLYGGEIELPERTGGGNLIGGILGSVAALAGDNKFESEKRPVFDEMSLRGKMSLGPMPKGWVQMRLRGFELPAVRGLAREAGVDIGDGLMGESTMLHFDGQGGLSVSSTTNFSYLSLSEPPGGPISSYLKLPAPLDSVLFVLKDEDGDHNIPLHLTMDEGGASLGKILGAVTKTLGVLIGEALASAPMRFVTGVVDLAGLTTEPIELTGDEWVDLPYGAGVVQAPGDLASQVAPLFDLLRRDPTLYLTVQHELGAGDVEQAMVLANPSREQCLDLAAFYRGRRAELLAQREEAAAAVHAAYAMGQVQQATQQTEALRLLDAELGRTESALDRMLERTRDQSERAQMRRTKSAALEVSRRRLSRVEAILRRAKVESIGTRIDVRRPRFTKQPEGAQGSIRISVSRRR